MYSVSNAFKEQMKSPIQEHKITGTIGSVSFDEANIVEGSFSISNQSTDTNDVVLGSCYVGQLTAEFVGINIEYGKWINKTITLSFGLKVGEYYEYVPMGLYKVKEAKHTDHGVQVTAYDNMIKFDRKFVKSHFMNLSGMTNIIDQLCSDAGVVCGMSHAQIEALPNGDRTGINIYGSKGKKAEFANDITTLRDLLFWVAQTLGCFATMNRAGQLEFRPYTQTVVDRITEQHRIAGATFADYVTHYIGIYVENLDDNTEDYYGYDATALQQELTETTAEITADQGEITDLEADRAEWVQKLANHECTQEEYDAAIAEIDAQEKALTKDINQLSKRVEWLSNAISMSADDGSDMVLGANPLVMAKNKTTRDEQRREILGALSNISYTPFQALVLCGCIYDLGDVIQWSGGLYNSDTDSFGCVMQYTYTHNGGTELEGFGVDPSVVVVRNKTQKSTDRATRNATTALNENDLVFDVDTDSNNKVVATNKNAYEQTSMTRKFKMWEYNYNFPSGQNWSKWDVEIVMPYPFSISIWPDLDHGNPRYCTFNGKTYQSMCVGLAIRPNSNIGAWTYITSQSWTRYAGNQSTGYNDFGTYVYRRNNLNYYNTGTGVGTIMYGPVDLNDVDYVFNNINEWYAAMDNGTMEIPTVSPDDECVLATESTAKQAAANVEYIAEKLAGNNPSRETETYSGNVNVMSEKTMQRLSDAFYSMGDNIGSITNNVDDVKVDGTSVVTSKVANINTMTGATSQADGAKGLVPAPTTTDIAKVLMGDGTWELVPQAVEITQAEYDALPSAEKTTDKKIYCIKDAGGSGGGGGGAIGDAMSIKHANWIATNVASNGANLTDAVTLEAGEYLIIVQFPYGYDGNTQTVGCCISVNGTQDVKHINLTTVTYGQYIACISLTETSTVRLVTVTSASKSWDSNYLDRGGLSAIRLTQLSPIIYSEEEREVGVWTDGKPLYAKTFNIVPTSTSGVVDLSTLHIEKIISRVGGITRNASGTIQQKALEYRSEAPASNNYGFQCELRGTNLQWGIWGYEYTEVQEIRVTLQYTKTTDVAGSGKYTTLGVPAVHYSTDEQIIGTWIDGKTLYRRTITDLSIALNGTQWVGYSGANYIDKLIDLHAYSIINGALFSNCIAEYYYQQNSMLYLCSTSSTFNRTINILTIEYTKTS